MKKFKSFYKMALPLLTIAATATAIPLAACSNSKKDDVKTLKLTLNDGNKDITGNNITIEYGQTKTYSVKSVMYGTTDLISTAQVQFVFNSVTYLNFTDNKDGTFTLANTNDSGSEVSTTLGVVVTDEATGLNQTVEYTVLGNSDTVAQATIKVSGSDYNDGRTIQLAFNGSDSLSIQDLYVNGELVADSDWQVEWVLADESQANSQYVQINNPTSKTECTVTNNNSTSSDLTIKIAPRINCTAHGLDNEELSEITFNFLKDEPVQPVEGYAFYTIVLDNAYSGFSSLTPEYIDSHKTTNTTINLNKSNIRGSAPNNVSFWFIIYIWDEKTSSWIYDVASGSCQTFMSVELIEGSTINCYAGLDGFIQMDFESFDNEKQQSWKIRVTFNGPHSSTLPEAVQNHSIDLTINYNPEN